MSRRGYLLSSVLLVGLYIFYAWKVPPADDELYYWCWSTELQPSYFDHPPMTAYLIRASTELFGHSLFAIRLPACLSSLTVLAVIGWLTRPRHLLPWIMLSPLFTFGGVFITPDTPLLLFWSLYLAWLVLVHRRFEMGNANTGIPIWMWLIGGIILGCGALGKYTMILAVPSGFLTFLLARSIDWRRWIYGYGLHGIIAFLVAMPVFVFNYEQNFVPFKFQIEHANLTGTGSPLKHFGTFLGAQILLFGMLPIVLAPWVLWRFRSWQQDARLRVCACFFLLPYLFFLYKSCRGPLEGNWALACYVGFWPLAAVWFVSARNSRRWKWFARSCFSVPASSVLLMTVHLLYPIEFIQPKQDRVNRQAGKFLMAQKVADILNRTDDNSPVYATTYQLTAHLRFHGVEARQLEAYSRPSNFTLKKQPISEVDCMYFFCDHELIPEVANGFDPPELIATIPLVVRNETLTQYQLFKYQRSGHVHQFSPKEFVIERPNPSRESAR